MLLHRLAIDGHPASEILHGRRFSSRLEVLGEEAQYVPLPSGQRPNPARLFQAPSIMRITASRPFRKQSPQPITSGVGIARALAVLPSASIAAIAASRPCSQHAYQ